LSRGSGSTGEWRDLLVGLIYVPGKQLDGEVLPRGILTLDQRNLLRSVPALELLLSIDGFEHLIEYFEIDQAMAAVFLAETIHQIVLMFIDAPLQIIRHSNVDYPRLAGDDVDAVAVSLHNNSKKQIPPLRIAIGRANRNAPVGMTDYFIFIA
jgi:hypothetical protein